MSISQLPEVHKRMVSKAWEELIDKLVDEKPCGCGKENFNKIQYSMLIRAANTTQLAELRKHCATGDIPALEQLLMVLLQTFISSARVKGKPKLGKFSELEIKGIISKTNTTSISSVQSDLSRAAPEKIEEADEEEIEEEESKLENTSPIILPISGALLEQNSDTKKKDSTFEERFPNLPSGRCPPDLFIHTLRPKYINALYDVDQTNYPDDWENLKRKPKDAWAALNVKMVSYVNRKYHQQGVLLPEAETGIHMLSVCSLKQKIIKAIDECFEARDLSRCQIKGSEDPSSSILPTVFKTLESLVARLSDVLAVCQSLAPIAPQPTCQPTQATLHAQGELNTQNIPSTSGLNPTEDQE